MGCTPNAKHITYLLVLCEMIKEHTFDILRFKKSFFLLSLEKIKTDSNFYFSGYHISSQLTVFVGLTTLLFNRLLWSSYVDSLEEYLVSFYVGTFKC